MPRPAVTMRRKGITSSGFSGPPNDSSRMPSYGLSRLTSDPAWGEVTGILRFARGRCGNIDCSRDFAKTTLAAWPADARAERWQSLLLMDDSGEGDARPATDRRA